MFFQQNLFLWQLLEAWYNNNTNSFRHRECMNDTELSKYVWNLKDYSFDNNLSWKIDKKVPPYQCGSKHCELCLPQKDFNIGVDPNTLLNNRTELISCRHRNNFFRSTLWNNCHGMVFSICPNSLIKTHKGDIFSVAGFC